MTYEPYQERRGRALYRIKRLRELDAPILIIRNEQLMLWGLRQYQYHDRYISTNMAMVQITGWQENYQKYVMLHDSEGTIQ